MSEKGMERVLPGALRMYVRISPDRLSTLLRDGGAIINELERRTQTKIIVDKVNGYAVIEPTPGVTQVTNVIKAQEILKALSIGFPPERAWRLLDEDQVLIIIDLKEVVGDAPNHLTRIKGRVIGEGGRVKKNIEEITGTYISVYEDVIGIIGEYERANIAREAVEMLIRGRQHSTVYRYLDRVIQELKMRSRME